MKFDKVPTSVDPVEKEFFGKELASKTQQAAREVEAIKSEWGLRATDGDYKKGALPVVDENGKEVDISWDIQDNLWIVEPNKSRELVEVKQFPSFAKALEAIE